MTQDDLSEYIRASEPHKRQRAENWRVANHPLLNREMLVGGGLEAHKATPDPASNPASNPASKKPALNAHLSELLLTLQGEMSRKTLMSKLALKDRNTFAWNYLEPALRLGYVEPTQPNSPRSPTQKYRLTEKAREIVSSLAI